MQDISGELSVLEQSVPFRTIYKNVHAAKAISSDALALQEVFRPRGLSPTERMATLFLVAADVAGWRVASLLVMLLVADHSPHLTYLWIAPMFAMVALYLINGYNRRTDFLSLEYFSEHLISIALATVGAMLAVYVCSAFNDSVKPSRMAIPFELGMFTLISIVARRFVGERIVAEGSHGSVLVVGAGKKADHFYRNCVEFGIKRKIKLVVPSGETAQVQSFGHPSAEANHRCNQPNVTRATGCDAVVLACVVSQLPPAVLRKLIRLHCSGVRVQTVEAFHEQHWQRVNAQAVGPQWLFDSEFRLAHKSSYSHAKRLMDIAISISALVILSPVLLLIACIVRLDSRGPAIFRQERVGREGHAFTLCKFRTMYENSGDIYTKEGDNRITRIGRWLRLFRLDELPQLWNVFVGEMSVIGPRAEWVKCAEIYEREIPHYHIRHLVHPGITGWAQVKYRYGENTEDALKKFEYDLYYIRNFSFKMDIRIIIKTIHTVICGKGR